MLRTRGSAPSGPADPTDKRIIYIGETSRKMIERWRNFDRAAFLGRDGQHSGGTSYRKVYGDKGRNLYVAAMGMELPGKLADVYRPYVERKLLVDYYLRHGVLPACNAK